ncbi:MAG: MarR family transcriptional regulator for hemolysin, partial [Alphaproteobacteria bacterium]
EEFGVELARVYRSWRALVDTQLRPLDMTQARWITLLHIARGGADMLQKDLAERMGIEGPTLVRLLDALEAAGWVTRLEAEGDRRGKTLALTDTALPIVDEIERVVGDSREHLLGDVSDEDIASCIRVFRHIREKISAYDDSQEIAERKAAGAD